ncbi:unnamed protein product [Bemisia tabaci]|uniref:Uncharacterized protein n=1 Tax=Bemisia tabaci TaxID=7038 RepID=A0AAI8UUV3_BEMTA|nr:unnamed protein product [Bemisia tabaci]
MEPADITINKREPITLGAIVNPSLIWACYPSGVNKRATSLKYQIDEELNEYFSNRLNRKSVLPEDLEKHTMQFFRAPSGDRIAGLRREMPRQSKKSVCTHDPM